jgi:hypothetical protein
MLILWGLIIVSGLITLISLIYAPRLYLHFFLGMLCLGLLGLGIQSLLKVSKLANSGERVFIEFVEEGKERLFLKAGSKDDDDLISCAMGYLKGK